MAGSRLDRIGTIFSRATGLIKAGAVNYADRPIWYDVYRIFPPKYEPHVDREAEKTEVLEIMYHEDKYRALFFKKFGMNPGGVARNLGDRNSEEPSQPFVSNCLKLKKDNPQWSDSQIFETAVENYKPSYASIERRGQAIDTEDEDMASKRHGRKPPTISAQSLLSLFKEAKEQQGKNESKGTTNDTSGGDKTN